MTALRHLKALADETRLRLALVLYHCELSVNELASLMDMGQSRISRHLKILTDSGLLHSRRDGLWAFYSAKPNGQGHEFLKSLMPYLLAEQDAQDDLARAFHILEERARSTRQFFNDIADDWDRMSREILGDFSLPDTVLKNLPIDCKTAVDLGCGTGEVLWKLRGACNGLIGVDNSPRMLDQARRRFTGAEEEVSLRIGELDHLPLRDGEACFACISLVLHHLSRPADALAEMSRVLHQGGHALITDFDQHNQEAMRTLYGDRWLGFPLTTLASWVEKAGLIIERRRLQPVKRNLCLHILLARKPG